jgi:hypothetical protein
MLDADSIEDSGISFIVPFSQDDDEHQFTRTRRIPGIITSMTITETEAINKDLDLIDHLSFEVAAPEWSHSLSCDDCTSGAPFRGL